MRRPPRHDCQWRLCGRPSVGYRMRWHGSVMFLLWFCRRHQRRWDAGVRGRSDVGEVPEAP